MKASAAKLFDLSGRHAVVAGGAGLLGTAFCEALLDGGARVTVLDVDAKRLAAAKKALRGAEVSRCDLTDAKDVERAVAAAERRAPIDVLVNAAAIDPKTDASAKSDVLSLGFSDYPVELWRKSMDVNLTGIFLVTQACCRCFEKRSRGVVINVSSTYGLVGPDQRLYDRGGRRPPQFKPGDYSTTKAGLIGFTKYLAAFYARRGIRVNCLTPGGTYNGHDKSFVDAYASRTLIGRMARREEYKGAILFLASEASSYMTGSNLVIDGGWTAI